MKARRRHGPAAPGGRLRRLLAALRPAPGSSHAPLTDAPRLLSPRAFRVCFVSDPGLVSHRYRALHVAEGLRRAGIASEIVARAALADHLDRIPLFDVVVLVRVMSDATLDELYRRCRRAGVPTVYDVDDLVFEPEVITFARVDALRFLTPADLDAYRRAVPRYRQALLDADCCSAPTDFLAARCRALGREAFVVRNGALAEPGPDAAPAVGGGVRFGYLSGSLTHQRDFAILSIPLARVMAARAEVTLRLVGDLEFSEFPELLRFLARVEHRPAVAWEGLAREWREIDVNLVPLEIGNPYCEAKSEIKFVEAAAQGVPTIASPTAPLAAAIRDGETGLLAATPAEWEAAMQRLAADPALRRRLGRAAREEVVARYGAAAVGAEARWACATLLSAQRAQRGWAETALALSVVVAPCDGDVPPGTRHLLDVVRALAEMGHEVRLFVAGEPAAVERSKHALWRDGYLGALRFAGSAAAMAACDVMVALDAVAARAAEPLAGLAMRAFAAGDASPAGEGPALLPERVLGADPAVAARALAELLQRQLEGDAAETAARRHV